MPKSISAMIVAGLGGVITFAAASSAMAQVVPQQAVAGAPQSTRPPVARQIEPMVAPVRRTAPKQMATPVSVPAAAIAAAAPPAPAKSAAIGTAVASGPPRPATLPPSVAALAAPPSKTPKIVVHTCRLGQDYSDKLQACFTPGVTKAANAGKAVRNKVTASVESGVRSALGAAKRK